MRKNNWKLATTSGCTLATLLLLAVTVTQSAPAQTFTVLHNFTRGGDGANPGTALTMSRTGGVLYGTTTHGGDGYGGVFELKPSESGWILIPLYAFTGGADGGVPDGALVIGPDGSLYGVTEFGGNSQNCSAGGGYNGCGVVYKLQPGPTACKTAVCGWNETVLYTFMGHSDGSYPEGRVLFDQARNIYGTTTDYETGYDGTVWELTPSGGGWSKTILHSFGGPPNDGRFPNSGVISDSTGNLYGTTAEGGSTDNGAVFHLMNSGSGWTENLLYSFQNGTDGDLVYAGLIFDPTGDLFSASSNDGSIGGGAAFELTPSGGVWTFHMLTSIPGVPSYEGGPRDSLTMDSAGNLYGTRIGNDAPDDYGSVFELTFPDWTYKSLHNFTGGADGGYPDGTVVLDSAGNIFGTASIGGNLSDCGGAGCGVVFEITPN